MDVNVCQASKASNFSKLARLLWIDAIERQDFYENRCAVHEYSFLYRLFLPEFYQNLVPTGASPFQR